MTIVLVGVASALALIAITVRARAGKPKKLEKLQKAQILKQLLARSERENMIKGISPRQSLPQSPTARRRAAAGRSAAHALGGPGRQLQ